MTHDTSIHLPIALHHKLLLVSQSLDRPPNTVAKEALHHYLDDQLRLITEAEEAVSAADKDPTRTPHREVARKFIAKMKSGR